MATLTQSLKISVAAACLAASGAVSATLLGVVPGQPLLNYDNGVLAYDATSDRFGISADPITILFPPFANVNAPEQVSINIEIDSAGNLVGGVPGDDLVITGDVQAPGPLFSGVLLTGEIIGFGFMDSGGLIDLYDFQFVVTGGFLASFYAGSDIGVTTASNDSTFTGDFAVDFGGGASGNIGPVSPGLPNPAPEPATLALFGLSLAGLRWSRRKKV